MLDDAKTETFCATGDIALNPDPARPPFLVDGCDTLPRLFARRCDELGPRTAHREKELGIWLSHSWQDFHDRAERIAAGLHALGLRRGEVSAILAENSKEWIYTDLAVMGLGAISTGVYTTDSAAQLVHLVDDSGARVLFVENDEQLDKFLGVEEQLPGLERVVVYDRDGLHDFSHPKVIFLDELYDLGREALARTPDLFSRAIAATRPDETAMLIYTSGTTGAPKGVEISHANIIFSITAGARILPVQADDEQLCFLPLCHILERLLSVFQPIAGRSTVNFAESPETVFENVQEVSPTVFTGVPRVWEKIYSRVSLLMNDATPLSRWAYARALEAGLEKARFELEGRAVPAQVAARYRLWDFAVLRNIRRMLGLDRIRRGTSGAAPIDPDLLRWFRAIGVPIYEGYGMSESAGLIAVNHPGAERLGTVGRAVPGASLRIAPDGEVQYRGGNCCKGYWKRPDKTAETYTDDGWLRTGDIGEIDADGYLAITGRFKDIIITAGGKNVTPAAIENRIKFSPYVSDAVVIGDRRKYLTCLVMIDQENVEKFAQDARVPFSDFASLCAAKEVRALVGGVIDAVNRDFARVEQIKEFRLIDQLLTAEDEELTATMKLKRGLVEKKHSDLVEDMYGDA